MNAEIMNWGTTGQSSHSAMCTVGVGSITCYEALEQVGEGTYGYVFRAIDKRDSSTVALKRMIIHKDFLGFPLCAVREIKFLKSLHHKNIVLLKDVAVSKAAEHTDKFVKAGNQQPGADEKDQPKDHGALEEASRVLSRCANLYLVFEYVEHDLGGLIDAKYKFSPRVIKSIMKQLFDVLEFLEGRNILHRDIKSSNILISNLHQVKLADFGLARSTLSVACGHEGRMNLTNNVVTMWYKAPELLLGSTRYSYSIDMWSAGCVLAELELGRPLFPGKSEPEQIDLICKTMGTFSEESWSELQTLPNYESLFKALPRYSNSLKNYSCNGQRISDGALLLLERVLVANPAKRCSAYNALGNRYFSQAPQAPVDPTDLPPLLATNESLHEFQTKQKRRAKEKEKAEEAASAAATARTEGCKAAFVEDAKVGGAFLPPTVYEPPGNPFGPPSTDEEEDGKGGAKKRPRALSNVA
jgi:cyclin-dependent kinase 12/13